MHFSSEPPRKSDVPSPMPPRTASPRLVPSLLLCCFLAACSTSSSGPSAATTTTTKPPTPSPERATAIAASTTRDAAVHLLPGDTLATDPRRSVVRIAMPESADKWWDKVRIGTGVYIGAGRVLTAHHVLYTGSPISASPLTLSVRAYDAGRGDRRRYTDPSPAATPSRDVALISLDEPPLNVQVASIARERPQIGDKLTGFGLGSAWRGGLRELSATVVSRSLDGNFIAISAPTVHGDSGGPVFNEKGELVGLMLGGGPDYQPWRVQVHPDRELEFSYTYPDFRSAQRIKGETLVIDLTQIALPK